MKPNLLKHSFIFGIISGGGIMAFRFILAMFANGDTMGVESGLTIVMIITTVFVAVRKYREQFQAGIISFSQAFQIGFYACLTIAVLVSIFTYLELAFLKPGMIEQIIVTSEETYLKMGMADEQVELASKIIAMIAKPGILAFFTLIRVVFWGTILSLIVGATMKRLGNPLLNNTENE